MTKKILSLAVAAAVLITAFTGCAPEDVALFKAMRKTAETGVTTTVTSFDVTVEEPLRMSLPYGEDIAYETDMPGLNYIADLLGGILSVTEMEQVTKKSGNMTETKTTLTLPDASLSFNSWVELNELGQAGSAVISIPSYVKPFIPRAVGNKEYLKYDPSGMFDVGAFGTDFSYADEDGTPAAFDPQLAVTLLPILLNSDEAVDAAAKALDVNLVSGVERTGDNTVYTLTLDGQTVKSIVNGVISGLAENGELAASMGMTYYPSAEEFAEAEETADIVCDFIVDSGMLDKGITVKYTVNRDGYIVRTETDMEMTLDIPRVFDAAARLSMKLEAAAYDGEYTEEETDEMLTMFEYGGRLRVAVKQVAETTDIGRPVTVSFPELTEENTLDCVKDGEEYADYIIALNDWENSWDDYGARMAFVTMHQPGDTLILRNNATGAETTTLPKTRAEMDPDYDGDWWYDDVFYIPLTDLAAIFDNMTVKWNEELMGVELMVDGVYEKPALILSPDGEERFEDRLYGGLSFDELYEKATEDIDSYDYEAMDAAYYETLTAYEAAQAGTPYENYEVNYEEEPFMFNGGKYYVDSNFFNWELDVKSRFEDGKFCYTPSEETVFDESYMEGNLFYEMDKISADI